MREVGLVARWLMVTGGRVRGREDEPLDPGPPSLVEQVHGPRDVGLERPERVADGVVDAGAGGQVDDRIDALDRLRDDGRVGQRPVDEVMVDAAQIGERADRQVVEDPHPIAPRDEAAGEVGPDESSPAGDEDGGCHLGGPPGQAGVSSRVASGTQRTFWTSVFASIRCWCALILSSIVSISSWPRRRGSRPRSSSFWCFAL